MEIRTVKPSPKICEGEDIAKVSLDMFAPNGKRVDWYKITRVMPKTVELNGHTSLHKSRLNFVDGPVSEGYYRIDAKGKEALLDIFTGDGKFHECFSDLAHNYSKYAQIPELGTAMRNIVNTWDRVKRNKPREIIRNCYNGLQWLQVLDKRNNSIGVALQFNSEALDPEFFKPNGTFEIRLACPTLFPKKKKAIWEVGTLLFPEFADEKPDVDLMEFLDEADSEVAVNQYVLRELMIWQSLGGMPEFDEHCTELYYFVDFVETIALRHTNVAKFYDIQDNHWAWQNALAIETILNHDNQNKFDADAVHIPDTDALFSSVILP